MTRWQSSFGSSAAPRVCAAIIALGVFSTTSLSSSATRPRQPIVAREVGNPENDVPNPQSAVTRMPPELYRTFSNPGPTPTVFAGWQGLVGGGSGGASPHPPDPHGAVGSSGIIQVVNHYMTYWHKDGSTYWSIPLDTFLGSPGTVVDPHAQFDRFNSRFYVTALEPHTTTSTLHLAVSKASHPLTTDASSWYFYSLDVTENIAGVLYGADYPAVGYDSLAAYVSCNMFTLPLGPFSSFKHARILILSKANITSGVGSFTSVVTPDGSSQGFSLQPTTVVGSPSPGNVAYFGEVNLASTTSMRVWALSDPLGSPSLASALVTVPNHGGAIDSAPQCNTSKSLSTFSPRAQGNAFWRNGSMWFCHTAGGSSGRGIVFYYNIATNGFPSSSPTLQESGGIDGGTGVWNYQPAIGGNANGQTCLVFTQSASGECPTIMVTARKSGTDAFPSPVAAAVSPTFYNSGIDNPGRWGDYASVSSDPFDETFWVTHELAAQGNDTDLWGTWWRWRLSPRCCRSRARTGRGRSI